MRKGRKRKWERTEEGWRGRKKRKKSEVAEKKIWNTRGKGKQREKLRSWENENKEDETAKED